VDVVTVTGRPYYARYPRPNVVYGRLIKGRTAEEFAEANRCHAEAVAAEAEKWLSAGWTVRPNVAVRNMFDPLRRRAVADLVAVSPDGNLIRVLEIKTGKAGYSPNQALVYAFVGQPEAVYAFGNGAQQLGIAGVLPWIGVAMSGHRYGDGKETPCSQMVGLLPPPPG
jgi:hypothetical protein